MASKATKAINAEMAHAQRLLWEKYNKPNRNLFQALSAFEANGVGRKVVALPDSHHFHVVWALSDDDRCLLSGRRRDSRIVFGQ